MNDLAPSPDATDPIGHAARQQAMASDPAVSAFVSASAGSGKTKLLIDRLLRLMLPDRSRDRAATPPERILCLTFTKAGAAEMAIRLRRVLGRWVVCPDHELDADLAQLDLAPDDALRADARALFARILDLPGGLRIGTIHAFCEQLLRRFPLEAAISPHFRLVEEHDAEAALDRAREHVVGRDEAASSVALLAARLDADRHSDLTRRLHAQADRLTGIHSLAPEALAGHLARTLEIAHSNEASLLDDAVTRHHDALVPALHVLAARGADGARADALAMLDWLALPVDARKASWPAWRDRLVTREGAPRAIIRANAAILRTRPDLRDILCTESKRVISVEHARSALALIEATTALLALSGPALAAYTAEKSALGILDFDDLIRRTRDLLTNPGVAWILFKLDGGLDHLLLDEVQDTSAAQWAIAGALTEEFFSGETAAGSHRTVFAVGDVKQSIYAFQGADPLGFQIWREHFRARAHQVATFIDPELTVSFRSSPAILRFVDAVFADDVAAAGVAVAPQRVPPHRSAQPGLAGAVELWPLATNETGEPASPWQAPTRNRGLASGQLRLADQLAARIADDIGSGRQRAGDILVLVRRRTDFAGALMRALKSRDVPVAGLDRMVLTEQGAVADLLALCDALLLPDDDLAFATVLTSPLGGLDDPALMDLAMGRGPQPLWRTLERRHAERPDWHAAHGFFAALLARVDYVSPYQLLAEALGARGGRARLLARFGPEAADAVDEFVAASLAHAATRIPSLQGFVHWVRLSGAEIKREPAEAPDSDARGEVRLMTVHGSKGLEARTVILADTTTLPLNNESILWPDDGTPPVWVAGADLRCPPVDRLRQAQYARALEEYNRLLYVALTRARQTLLVCGWQSGRAAVPDERSWYAHCARAFAGLPAETLPPDPTFTLEGDRRRYRHPGHDPVPPGPSLPRHAATPPAWAGAAPAWRALPPGPEPAHARSLTPSRPEGVRFGPVPPAASPRARAGRAEARRRGDLLHALLQHLPDLAAAERDAAAHRFARARLPAAEAVALAAEALAILAHPALALVFGPDGRPEQRIAGRVGDVAIAGIVDRLAITVEAIHLVDFKSGRAAPPAPGDTPVFYLRQMAAYRGVLQTLRPGTPVRCALVWTAGATVTELPDELLDAHAPARTSLDHCPSPGHLSVHPVHTGEPP